MRKASWSLILLTLLLALATPLRPSSADPAATTMVYLPLVRDERPLRRVNAPFFNGTYASPRRRSPSRPCPAGAATPLTTTATTAAGR